MRLLCCSLPVVETTPLLHLLKYFSTNVRFLSISIFCYFILHSTFCKILCSLLRYIYLTATVTHYFSEEDFTLNSRWSVCPTHLTVQDLKSESKRGLGPLTQFRWWVVIRSTRDGLLLRFLLQAENYTTIQYVIQKNKDERKGRKPICVSEDLLLLYIKHILFILYSCILKPIFKILQ